MIQIKKIAINERHDTLINTLINVWLNSVRATHLFLTKSDIKNILPQVNEGLLSIPNLLVAFDDKKPVGFAGIYQDKLEMLFILPEYFGQGIGYKLISTALDNYHINAVDVNEQNPNALKFYERQGFQIISRSAKDDMNRPFPILHLSLKTNS